MRERERGTGTRDQGPTLIHSTLKLVPSEEIDEGTAMLVPVFSFTMVDCQTFPIGAVHLLVPKKPTGQVTPLTVASLVPGASGV